VRWNWQRDVTHRFRYREQAMRSLPMARWRCAFYTAGRWQHAGSVVWPVHPLHRLDDERVMRHRLERLLCWRESAERWSCYQHMLPVLILARSSRQHDHWQRAVEATALKLRLAPLSGALACLPYVERADGNPWVLNWRTLSTAVPVTCKMYCSHCHKRPSVDATTGSRPGGGQRNTLTFERFRCQRILWNIDSLHSSHHGGARQSG